MEGVVEGAAFQTLFNSLVRASLTLSHFKSRLDRLKETLLLINNHSYNFNTPILHHESKAFTDLLLKGQRLVENCSRVKWNVFKRLYYAYKLRELEASLLRFFQIDVAALHYVESKNISERMSHLEDRIDEIAAAVMKGNEPIRLPRLTDVEAEQQVPILGSSSQDHIMIPHTINDGVDPTS